MTRMTPKSCAAACVAAALLVGSGTVGAKGCIKGAAVGGVAGHFAHHHAVLGAAAGCVVGHHLAKKREREARAEQQQRLEERQPRLQRQTTAPQTAAPSPPSGR